jgi:hypothetical protein
LSEADTPIRDPIDSATAGSTPAARRILGIDPGLRSTGYGGVIQTERG